MSYTEPPIREHLDAFYAPVGGVEHNFLAGANYILNECEECGLIYQEEVPNEGLMFKLYEKWLNPKKVLNHYKKHHDMGYFIGFIKEIINLITYFDTNPSELTFFDFGIGWGNWSYFAKGFNCDVYGNEISQTRVEHAKASGIKMIGWDDIPDYQFDFINTEQVFEHLSDPLDTLMHLKRGLKPGGIIKISVPNGSDIKERMKTWDWTADRFRGVIRAEDSLNPVAPLQHINCFSRNALVKMATKASITPVPLPQKFSLGRPQVVSLKAKVKGLIRTAYRVLAARGTPEKTTTGLRLYFTKAAQLH